MRGVKWLFSQPAAYWISGLLLGVPMSGVNRDVFNGESTWDHAQIWYNGPAALALIAVGLVAQFLFMKSRARLFRSVLFLPFVILQMKYVLLFLIYPHPKTLLGALSCLLLIICSGVALTNYRHVPRRKPEAANPLDS